MRSTLILFFSGLAMCSANAQTLHDDCTRILSKDELALLKQERLDESLALSAMQPAVKIATQYNVIPTGTIKDMHIKAEAWHINGFFSGIVNADNYLTVISGQENLDAFPVNGIQYKTGMPFGNGTVINAGEATAFTGFTTPGTYWVYVYAANSNSATGMLYDPTPIYKTQVVAKPTAGTNFYFGNLHSHSSYSDGNKDNTALTPADDYAYAKNSQCMDFLGISEHNHFSSTNNPGMHLADYQPGITAANQFTTNNPGFLALYGMEWGVINNGGHVIIYGVDSLIGWETLSGNPNYDIYVGEYDYTGTNGLFHTVSRFAYNKSFASFAHPDNTDYDSLRYIPLDTAADNAVVGCAIESGPAFSTDTSYTDDPTSMGYLSYFKAMLAKGYHIGPFIDQDTHYLTFGRNTKARQVVIAPSLSKNDFFDAMRAMHFYATEICDTKIDMDVSGQLMGSVFAHQGAPSINISASNATYPGTPVISILMGVPGSGFNPTVIATNTGATLSYTDNTLADGNTAYYYADITINGKRTITSPVWYTRNDGLSVGNVVPNLLVNDLIVKGNPVRDNVLHLDIATVQNQDVLITIHDIAGRVLLSKNIASGNTNADINMTTFTAGTYIVSARFFNETVSRLIVK